jgi:hypothetical protein
MKKIVSFVDILENRILAKYQRTILLIIIITILCLLGAIRSDISSIKSDVSSIESNVSSIESAISAAALGRGRGLYR